MSADLGKDLRALLRAAKLTARGVERALGLPPGELRRADTPESAQRLALDYLTARLRRPARTDESIAQGQELRRLRRAAGLTQAQLGALVDASESVIGRAEGGYLSPPCVSRARERALALARAGDVHPLSGALRGLREERPAPLWVSICLDPRPVWRGPYKGVGRELNVALANLCKTGRVRRVGLGAYEVTAQGRAEAQAHPCAHLAQAMPAQRAALKTGPLAQGQVRGLREPAAPAPTPARATGLSAILRLLAQEACSRAELAAHARRAGVSVDAITAHPSVQADGDLYWVE